MADAKWRIVYYKKSDGSFPVYDFISNLEERAKAKIINTLDLLEFYGIRLGLPHVKKLSGTDLWELRILGGDNIRIFYVSFTGKSFLLLHGFIKKSQKTPSRELKLAQGRLRDHLSRRA